MRTRREEDFLYADYINFTILHFDGRESLIICFSTCIMQVCENRCRMIYTVPMGCNHPSWNKAEV